MRFIIKYGRRETIVRFLSFSSVEEESLLKYITLTTTVHPVGLYVILVVSQLTKSNTSN